ncbi:MAG: hypothetical protein WCG75_10490, partial [Armatimonadota bacterium]
VPAFVFSQRLGDLMISPTRLTLDEKSRGGTIIVVNSGQSTVRYRLNLIDMNMSPEGVLKKTSDVTRNSAISSLRLSPKEIILAPGASQKIRILSVVPLGSIDGEMRSHLEFEPLTRPATTKSTEGGEKVLSTNLNVRLLVTIPIMVRMGNVSSSASLSNGSLDPKGSSVKFTLHRDGNASIRGDVFVRFKPANGGKAVLVGQSNGVAVYFPNPTRSMVVSLSKNISSLGPGEVEVQFVESDRRKNPLSKLLVIHSR